MTYVSEPADVELTCENVTNTINFPCKLTNNNRTGFPKWIINDTTYHCDRLPPDHEFDGLRRVLTITNIRPELNNSHYKCVTTYIRNGAVKPKKYYSSVGRLIIKCNSKFMIFKS